MQHPQVVTDSRFSSQSFASHYVEKDFSELVFELLLSVGKFPVYLVEMQLNKIPCKRVNTVQGHQLEAINGLCARQVQLKPDTLRQRC